MKLGCGFFELYVSSVPATLAFFTEARSCSCSPWM